ncbi:MAG: hypothetical protein AAF937_00240 [Planctomycetota bacterium]
MTGTPIDIVGLASLATGAAKRFAGLGGSSPSSFADVLGQTRSANQSSGLPVNVAAGVDVELSADQMQRLAQAADRAGEQGAQSAVVMIDGRALELDVTLREITGEVNPDQGLRPEVDTFLFAPPASTPVTGPESVTRNADLLKILSNQRETRDPGN